MSEQPPQPEQPRYATERDQALHIMAQGLWANDSAHSDTASVYLISNSEVELPEIIDAFVQEFAAADFTDYAALLGNFVLVDKAEQPVEVVVYPTAQEAEQDFRVLEHVIESRGGDV
jgi:hypothetical protein